MHTFTEVFPVNISVLPRLFAYRLTMGNSDTSEIGWKLTYRLKIEFGGHWIWSSERIIADKLLSESEIMTILETLWQEQVNTFRKLFTQFYP